MSAKQGVFGALLGLLNFSLKYILLASSVFYVALASYHAYLEGSSYLGASLYILFFIRFFGLLLVPSSNPISPSLRLLGHTAAKVVALILWSCGIALLLRENYQDTVFLREVVTICMSACIFLILPVTHLEATGGDQHATLDTALDTSDTVLDTSDTVVAVVPSDQGRGRSICSAICSYWKKVLAIWFVLVCVCSFSSQPWEGRINTSANGIMGKPTIVNNTTIVSDICLLPPELPTTASLTMPRIPHSTPACITSIGTPFQVTPTRTQPSTVAKSTWAPAMSTTMPTPEPTPAGLPVVEPEPEPVPEPAPQAPPDIAAALQDVSDAFNLMLELFTAKAKSILPPQAKSALSWYLSLRFEDRWVAFVLAFLFAWALFTGLVAVASVISAPAILPLTCLTSTGVFFCLQHYGVTRDVSIIICAVLCVVLTVAIVMADFLAYLLRKLRLLGSHVAEVPRVKADVSRIASDLYSLIGEFGKLSGKVPQLHGDIAEVQKKLGDFIEATNESNESSDRRSRSFSFYVQVALAYLYLVVRGLGRRLTGLESDARLFRTQMDFVHGRLRELQSSKASAELVDELKRIIKDIEARFGELKNTAEDDEARRMLQDELYKLSARVDELFKSLDRRIDGLESQLRNRIGQIGNSITEILKSLRLLTPRVDTLEQHLRQENKEREEDNEKLRTELAEREKDNEKLRTELAEEKAERKADKKASDEKFVYFENMHNSLSDKVMGIVNGHVTKEDLNKVQGDVKTLADDAKKDRAENKKAINKSEEDRRAEQAKYEAKVDERFQSSDDKMDSLQKDFNSQSANTNKRVEEVSEQVETIKTDSSNGATPSTLHPDVARQFSTFIKLQVAQQLQALFGGSQLFPVIYPIVAFIMQHIIAISGDGPFSLWAAHPTTGDGRQQRQPFTGPPPVPPAAGSGEHHFSGLDLFNVDLISHIWQSCLREWPRWPNALEGPGGERLLLQFIGSRMPRSLTPPNCPEPLSDVGEADSSDHAEVEPGDDEPDGGGAAEDSQHDGGNDNTPDAPQEPSSGGQAEAPDAEPSNSSSPADNTSDEHEPLGAPQETEPDGPQTQPGDASPNDVEADPSTRSDPSTPSNGSNNVPHGMGGHPQGPDAGNPDALTPDDADARRDTHSDAPTPADGSNNVPHGAGEHSQGSDSTAPGSSSSEAEGSSDNTSNPDNSNTGDNDTKSRTYKTPEQQEASLKRQMRREEIQGFPIHQPTGAVTDPNGDPGDDPVACVRKHGKRGKVSLAGNKVDSETQEGWIRIEIGDQNLVVARLWLPGESGYRAWLEQENGYKQWLRRNDPSVQGAADDGAAHPASPSEAETHDDGASKQSSGGRPEHSKPPGSSSTPGGSGPPSHLGGQQPSARGRDSQSSRGHSSPSFRGQSNKPRGSGSFPHSGYRGGGQPSSSNKGGGSQHSHWGNRGGGGPGRGGHGQGGRGQRGRGRGRGGW